MGVIGVGTMGQNHVRIYSELKGVDNVYIYDVDGDATKRMGVRYGVSVSGSMDSLLKSLLSGIGCDDVVGVFERIFGDVVVDNIL